MLSKAPKPPAPPAKKRPPAAPIVVETVGEPARLSLLARLLLPYLQRPAQGNDALPCELPHDGAPRPRTGD